MVWQAFCCKEASHAEVVSLANRYHHPGTTNGWQWPNDEALKYFCEVNNEKFAINPPMTVEEFNEGIVCQARRGYRHYLLNI